VPEEIYNLRIAIEVVDSRGRPGPLESGMVEDYVKRKHKKVTFHYELPELKPIYAGFWD